MLGWNSHHCPPLILSHQCKNLISLENSALKIFDLPEQVWSQNQGEIRIHAANLTGKWTLVNAFPKYIIWYGQGCKINH